MRFIGKKHWIDYINQICRKRYSYITNITCEFKPRSNFHKKSFSEKSIINHETGIKLY